MGCQLSLAMRDKGNNMSNWSTDMSAAPKGHTVERTVKINGKMVKRNLVEIVYIWVAGRRGHVTRSHWISEWGRWEMFLPDSPPLAWRPYDENEFLIVDEDGKQQRSLPDYPSKLLEEAG